MNGLRNLFRGGNDEILFFILVFLLLFNGKIFNNRLDEAGGENSAILFFIIIFLLLFFNNDCDSREGI